MSEEKGQVLGVNVSVVDACSLPKRGHSFSTALSSNDFNTLKEKAPFTEMIQFQALHMGRRAKYSVRMFVIKLA